MMDYVLAAIGIVAIILLLLGLLRKNGQPVATDTSGMLLLQKEVAALRSAVDVKLSETTQRMETSLTESSRLVKDITSEIGALKDIGVKTGQFADEVRKLQDTLTNPRQRGRFGEHILERVLADVLGAGVHETQYAFKDRVIVDAVIKIDGKLIPIDSKFSLENYNKLVDATEDTRDGLERALINDLKKRIEETAKYIRPHEGTMNFAFMFVPAEGIYYELLTNRIGREEGTNLIRQAAQRNVIIVSPTTLFAYLQTVLQGLKALAIERDAESVIKNVEQLGLHIQDFEKSYRLLGKQLGVAVGHYNTGYRELNLIDKDVLKVAGISPGIEPELIDKPSQE